jgi:hypothetical protein
VLTRHAARAGGLAITISPVVGKKECWLVHRDDGDCVADGAVDTQAPNLHRFPRYSTARAWHVVLRPGQVKAFAQCCVLCISTLTLCTIPWTSYEADMRATAELLSK